MKRILVFSDTHGDIKLCERIINRLPCDLVIHAGDYVRDAQELRQRFPDKDIRYVQGNGDLFTYAPKSEITEVDGVRIFAVHGHEHRVKYESDYRTLAAAAEDCGCNVAVFGHTHEEYEGKLGKILRLNPGSARYGVTYGIMEIDNGVPSACIIREESVF